MHKMNIKSNTKIIIGAIIALALVAGVFVYVDSGSTSTGLTPAELADIEGKSAQEELRPGYYLNPGQVPYYGAPTAISDRNTGTITILRRREGVKALILGGYGAPSVAKINGYGRFNVHSLFSDGTASTAVVASGSGDVTLKKKSGTTIKGVELWCPSYFGSPCGIRELELYQ